MAEQLELDYDGDNLTLKFAKAILKNRTRSYEATCHNDRWTEHICAFCGQSQSWSPPYQIVHKSNCVVLAAENYVAEQEG